MTHNIFPNQKYSTLLKILQDFCAEYMPKVLIFSCGKFGGSP